MCTLRPLSELLQASGLFPLRYQLIILCICLSFYLLKILAVPAPAKKTEKAKVLFDYEKQNDDELNLTVGDIVTINNKDVYESEGWWEGELNGIVGLFPDNFVELLPEEEEVKVSVSF
jgi:hypothetical protein